MNENLTVSETLNRAADLIEERGWTTGPSGWNGKGGALCLEGGIIAALGYYGWRDRRLDVRAYWQCPAHNAVMGYLGREHGEAEQPLEPLFKWNYRQRSAEAVIAALRACAVIEAAKEQATEQAQVPA